MIREDLKFQNTAIKSIVETIFWKLNTVSVLPFSLGKNDCEELISIEFKAFTSLYTILKELSKKVSDLQIRHRSEIVGNGSKEYLDISKNCGVQHSWIWSDNANIQQRNSKVVSREWKDSLWNTCNYWRDNNGNIRENQSSISQWLLFEKFEQNPEKTPDELVESAGLVTIVPEVSREEMTQLTVGDQKAIRLIARLEWARFEYLGIIQEISFGSNSAGGLDFSIKIWEKLIEQKNILDKTLANLASAVKKSWPSHTPAPQVDLSWYATSSAVSSAVQWVAQTAQTALNAANQAKQTAESKAPIQHTHNKSEVWLDQVDNTSDEDKPVSKATKKALELKCSFADIVDNLNTEEIKPLSAKQGKVLKGFIDNINRILVSDDIDLDQLQEIVNYIKQNKKILSQLGISNISGLQSALNGKANKEHAHTKSQISDFPTSMPASDVHEWAKKNKKPDYAWEEINNKPETFTPSTHKHKATDIENIGEVVTQAAVKKALGEVSSDQDGYLTSSEYSKLIPKNWETRGNPLDYEKMTINTMGANRLAFLNPEQVLVETSTDWTNWSEYALADNKKRNLFNGINGSNDEIQVGKDMQIRVTLDSWINNKSERYVTLEKLYLRTTTAGDNIAVKIEKADLGNPDKWILVSDYSGGASNRPGNIVVQHNSILFGCYNKQQTNNWRKVRITLKVVNPQAKFARYKRWLWGIKWFGMSVYTAPNTMMKYGSLFSWDNDQNAIFPGLVKSSATPRSQEDLVNKKYVDDLDIPTVPAWAKQENKPDYDWNEIKNKPDKFTPSEHNHNQVYHTKEEIAQLLSGLPNVPENMLTAGNLNNRVREISGWIVVPGNGSGSASIYLRHPNGRMYEFFSDGNGAFGVRDKTNNRDVFRITPNETIFYKELNANNLKIKNLADPNNNKDAVNKQYVDKKITEVNTALQNLGQTNQQVLTKAEWKALAQKDPNKIYFVKGVGIYVGAEKIIAQDTSWLKMLC